MRKHPQLRPAENKPQSSPWALLAIALWLGVAGFAVARWWWLR